jgi:hypothetical protein
MKKLFVLALVALASCHGGTGTTTAPIPKDTVTKIDSLINNAPDTLKAK